MFALLRSTCLSCHGFRMSAAKIYRYAARLKLVYAGLIFEAMELEGLDFTSKLLSSDAVDDFEIEAAAASDEHTVGSGHDILRHIDRFVAEAFKKHNLNPETAEFVPPVTLTNDYLRRLIKEFLAKAGTARKCENCSVKSPSLRCESHSKIFEMALSGRDKAANEVAGYRQQNVSAQAEENGGDKSIFLTALQVREHLRLLWEKEKPILDLVFGSVKKDNDGKMKRVSSHEQFFLEVVPVPPNRFRPVSRLGDQVFDHAQNGYLNDAIKANNRIVELRAQDRRQAKEGKAPEETPASQLKQLIDAWITLQESVNNFNDSSKNPKAKVMPPGVKQIMEKKEGLFRKHMMGKRVNYAARSVISPDPMIETSEIGIPMVFAKKLTYPEPVTDFNFKQLRQCVINGPENHPGAISVQNEDGSMTMLANCSHEQRVAIANQLLTPPSNVSKFSDENAKYVNKKVYRHLRNGDMLLLNRQPTLHKPSIMGHIARVLPQEKTIRMHYANCNTYNADFDGDEMNVHFPQNAIAQAEARLIANNSNQYLVPTSGEPLRGLIQDHVVTGVLMTQRDAFFTKQKYVQLLYSALPNISGRILMIPPALVKPQALWTGKQIISTILLNLTKGQKPLNLDSKAQTPSKSWAVLQAHDTEEGDVIIRDGHLLTGVLDKKQFGAKAYGLVHACFEVYGADCAGQLLTMLGRLFTAHTQMKGFTCRMDDLVVTPDADKFRRGKIQEVLKQGKEILKEFAFGDSDGSLSEGRSTAEKRLRKTIKNPETSPEDRSKALKVLNALEDKRLFAALENTIRSDEKLAALDNKMKSKTGNVTTTIVKGVIPNGLYKPFPDNGMQLMTVSGAKGSNVNVTQISCMLGQQELEGRRVPVMVSGKTLPSFRAYDLGPRAGGYITGRFLTGIKPQEYYFHCMAGREGLVDTAVKTARSGYLQRCIIKHLEGLKVNYDHTVRDCADGSVYQFHYGEDSLDVTKASYLTKFKFNAQNYEAFIEKYNPVSASKALDCAKGSKYMKKSLKKPKKYDPALSLYAPGRYLGSVSEKFQSELQKYIDSNPDGILKSDADMDSTRESQKRLPKPSTFEALMHLKFLHSLVDAGEAVGLLAAQSIGEPSTQMTLNTFHFAGHGAKNVTLGIPRLREIIMTASTKPKTPQMLVPFLEGVSREDAEKLCRKLSRVTLDQILEEATVTETLMSKAMSSNNERARSYTIRLKTWKKEDYESEYGISMTQVQHTCAKIFVRRLCNAITKELKNTKRKSDDEIDEIGKGANIAKFNETSDKVDKDAENEDSALLKKKGKKKDGDDSEIEDAYDADASAASRAAKRKQQASYDAPDDEDKDIMDQIEKTLADAEALEAELPDVAASDESSRQQREEVISGNQYVREFRFDKFGEWCEIQLEFPASTKKLLMVGIVESVAPTCVITEVSGITKCFLSEDKETGRFEMTTDGVNIQGLWAYPDLLDISKISSNDIASILNVFGVEAARKTIQSEISSVFAAYGIEVDERHLCTVADYMCFEGGYKPFNRIGIESCPSPFAKMTFETSFQFLTAAALHAQADALQNPSARLVTGSVVKSGTGSFEVLQPMV